MPFLIGGCVLLVAAAALFLGSSFQARKLALMAATQTSTAVELAELAAAVGKEIGPGSFNQVTELKGSVECAQPLLSELSQTPCVHYSMKVTREYEEEYWEKDQNGNQVRRSRRGSEPVASNARSLPFLVRDSSGTMAVEPEGASFVDEKVFSRFEQGTAPGGVFRFGSYSLSSAGFPAFPAGRRTIGYRFEESAIPVGRQVYVLGEAVDREGRLRVCKPGAKGLSFLISLKSEEELAAGAKTAATGLRIGALASAALGIAGILFGLLKGS